jgi:hypothetical protein
MYMQNIGHRAGSIIKIKQDNLSRFFCSHFTLIRTQYLRNPPEYN